MWQYFSNLQIDVLSSSSEIDVRWLAQNSVDDGSKLVHVMAWCSQPSSHGPLARYEKLQVAHAPGMPGTFSLPPRVSDPDMHHGTCVTHVPRSMPGSIISGFRWSRWRGSCSRHSRRMRNTRFYVSGKRPIVWANLDSDLCFRMVSLSHIIS